MPAYQELFFKLFLYAITVAFFSIPFVVFFILQRFKRWKKFKNVFCFVLSAAIMSGSIVWTFISNNEDLRKKYEVATQKDKSEWTEEDHKAVLNYIGDGGRNVFFVIGVPFFVIYPLIVTIMLVFINKGSNKNYTQPPLSS